MIITYEAATKELERQRQEWIKIGKEIEDNYLHPKESFTISFRATHLDDEENKLSRNIKETWTEESNEKTALRMIYKAVQTERTNAMQIAQGKAKVLFGMQSKEQQATTAKILNQMDMTPPARKMRLVVETTDKATPKTFKILKDTMFPAFKVPHEYKQGEYTVNLESE